MAQVSASSTILINAEPKAVLNAVADYREVRPRILSSNYSQYRVLEGGHGQGRSGEIGVTVGDRRQVPAYAGDH